MSSKLQILVPVLLMLVARCPASANTLSLTFEVDVYAQFTYATRSYNPNFQPFSTVLAVAFNDAVTAIEQDTHVTLVFFGSPLVNSPLTATLPYVPANPRSQAVAIGNDDYSPTFQASEFIIVQSHDDPSGPNNWAYSFDLRAPLYPFIADPLNFGPTELYQRLRTYKQDHAAFTYSESAQQFDSLTGESLAGVGFNATAYLVDVTQSPVPEPSTVFLLSIGLLGVFAAVDRRNTRNSAVIAP